MKRILCIILAASVLASVTALAAGGSPLRQTARRLLEKGPAYQASEWAETELAQAEEAALIPAALENSDLTKPITRQEYAAAAVALYDQLLALNPGAVVMEREAVYPEGRQGPFTDVDDEAVTAAYRRGLIEGVGHGKFDPDGTLTREQAATILQRILAQAAVPLPGLCGTSFVNMTDTDRISPWAKEGAALMANLGIIQGKPDGNGGALFHPWGTLTGQEALVMNGRLARQAEGFLRDGAGQAGSFNADFFAAVTSNKPNKTLSPVSARYALGLLRAGAEGETRAQLDRLLAGADFAAWNQALRSTEGGPTVEVANSIWFDLSVTPDGNYLNTVAKDFDAQGRTVALTAQSGVQAVNRWVAEKTHGLIQSILDQPLPDEAAAVVLNALYFKGDWTFPFDPNNTHDQTFRNGSGKEVQVPFLHSTRRGTQYIRTDTCVGVALPYKGGSLELPQGADPSGDAPTNNGWWMIALLPKDGTSPERLAAENFDALLGNAADAYVRLSLPKFTLEGSYDLTGPLKDLGLTAAFAGGDFSPMGKSAKGDLALSSVIQKTYLRVDEKGTEAAAVTGAIVATTAFNPEEPLELTFDRPFLCCLWNSQISQPLFLSVVEELG